MKILIAPLNWGLGHASRCVPLVQDYLSKGNEVVLAGDGDSLLLLRQHFPTLRVIDLPALELRYDENPKQLLFYWRAIPALLRFTLADRYYLHQLLAREHFDRIISDNRFGLFSKDAHCIYITHQLYPILPHRLSFFQPIVRAIHARIYKRYDEVWVPDYESCAKNLSGRLSHGGGYDSLVKYIGPLSRFSSICHKEIAEDVSGSTNYSEVAILSGLEPQRTIFEREILARFADTSESVLLIKGKVREPRVVFKKNNITIIPSISDEELALVLGRAQKIIVRSGYSTIMDLNALGVLHKAEFHPTPGQSEQEYLSQHMLDKQH